jgi:hypothetical protein
MKEKTIKTNLCLSESTIKKVRELANKWDRSVSSTIRTLIDLMYSSEVEEVL